MSSKPHNHQGRSLAAVRHICETLEVISKTADSAAVFSKKMNSSLVDRFAEVPSLADTLPQQGTIVIVASVFSSLPVRQRCINWQRETVGIRDWITALSLFHHKINWTIRELSSSQLCYRIKSTASVAQALIGNFGSSIIDKICQVDVTFAGYRLVGFVSKPTHDCCMSNKENQFLFVSQRLIHNSGVVGHVLNKGFTRLLASQNRPGFNARHMDLHIDGGYRYPFFLLQLSCPHPYDVDIQLEPNKSMIFFRQPADVEQLLIQLLKLLQEKFAPSMGHAIAAIEQKYGKSTSVENVSSTDNTKVTTNSPALDKFLLEQALQKAIHPQTPLQHSKEEVLSEAFNMDPVTPSFAWQRTLSRYSSSPFTNASVTKSSHCTPEAATGKGVTVARFTSELINDDNNSAALSLRQNEVVHVATHSTNPLEGPQTSSPTWIDDDNTVEGEKPEVTIGDYMIRHEMVKEGYMLHQQLQSSSPVGATTRGDPTPRVRNPDNAVNTSATSLTANSSLKRPRSASKDEMEQSKCPKTSEASPWTTLLSHTRPLSLQKSSIMSSIHCIGQVDRKYIACIAHESTISSSGERARAGSQLLILLDQHAVDERINLELLQAETVSPLDRRTIILSPPQRLTVDVSMAHTLHEQMALFRSWCFTYQIYQHNHRTSHYDVVSFNAPLPYDGGSFGSFIVEVLSVPLIHGDEVLTADDLIEFCTHVQMQREVPDSLLAPPAVHRILTSKACRSSLKFGQFMEQQEMNLLLSRWQQTGLPFQCAHGRPSAIPLLDLTVIEETLVAQEAALASVDLLPLLSP